jgi:hypothetical protein
VTGFRSAKTRGNPIPCGNRLERHLSRAAGRADQAPDRRLVRRLLEMDLDVPAPVDAFERRDGGLGKVQMLGKRVREALCRRLVASEAGEPWYFRRYS